MAYILLWSLGAGLMVKLLNAYMTEMNKLTDSQSFQSPCSVVGTSRAVVSELPLLDEMALDARGGYHFVVIPIADMDKVSMNAIRYARLLGGAIVAVHILLNPSDRVKMEYRWKMQNIDIPLFILESPNGSIIEPLMTYVDRIRRRHKESFVTIVLPVLITQKWWHRLLHNQTARLIERAFQREAGVVTIRVPFFLARTKNEEQNCTRG
jgi:hypothetical protein